MANRHFFAIPLIYDAIKPFSALSKDYLHVRLRSTYVAVFATAT
jgi:hypothetical protein